MRLRIAELFLNPGIDVLPLVKLDKRNADLNCGHGADHYGLRSVLAACSF